MKKPVAGIAVTNNKFLLVAAIPEWSVVFACLWGGHARRQIGHLEFLVCSELAEAATGKKAEMCKTIFNRLPE